IERSGDDMVFLYTGGTTGMPKGVMWRQGFVMAGAIVAGFTRLGVEPPALLTDLPAAAAALHADGVAFRLVPGPPLMHGTGLASSVGALAMGGTVVTLTSRHFDAQELWSTVQAQAVNRITIVGDP